MKKRSLSQRAIVAVLLIEFLCAAVFSGTALWHERNTRLEALDAVIRGRSDSLIGAVQDAEDPAANILVDPSEFTAPPRDVYAVYNPDGRLVGSSRNAPPSLITPVANGFRNERINGRHYRVLQRDGLRIIDREETHGIGLKRPVVLIYAMPAEHVWHEIVSAARFYILLSLGLVCTTVIAFLLLVRRLFQPILDLATEAERVNVTSLTFDPPQTALEVTELKPLAEALSDTVTRLRHAFEQEQRFISDATHELKTAVAVVRSTIQVMTMRPRSVEEYESGLQKALTDNERLEELTARMLTLARYQNNVALKTAPLDLGKSIEGTLERLSSVAEAREIRLNYHTSAGCMVQLSEEAADILLSNLVMNAIQHSSSRSAVDVTLCIAKEDPGLIELSVVDQGAGIAPESLSHVFERFFREDPSRARATGGAGLGLAICKSIVEGAGGSIQLQSNPGNGTKVKATFRLA